MPDNRNEKLPVFVSPTESLPMEGWINKEQLRNRMTEEEVVEINDFFSTVSNEINQPPMSIEEELVQQGVGEHQPIDSPQQTKWREDTNTSLPYLSFSFKQTPYTLDQLVQEVEKKDSPNEPARQKRKKLDEMDKDELIHYLSKIPPLMPRPICEFTIKGKKIEGYIEKVKDEIVYIKVSYGRKWIKHPITQIKSVKIVRL